MGWTGYPGLTAREAVEFELRGVQVLKRSGNWAVWRNDSGYVGLTYFITQRSGGRHAPTVAVKPVDIGMGPGVTPPKAVAVEYLKHYNGDVETAGGTYGADLLRKAVEPKRKPHTPILPGYTVFTIPDTYTGQWSDNVPMAGTYIWLGRYKAQRSDGARVTLPRWWRKAWLTA